MPGPKICDQIEDKATRERCKNYEGEFAKPMSEEKTSAIFQGSPNQVTETMKRNPSFRKGMEMFYGVTLGDDDTIKTMDY